MIFFISLVLGRLVNEGIWASVLKDFCGLKLTCIMLSSDTEQMTQGSFGFHEKSDILAVCPPWIN